MSGFMCKLGRHRWAYAIIADLGVMSGEVVRRISRQCGKCGKTQWLPYSGSDWHEYPREHGKQVATALRAACVEKENRDGTR